MLSIASLVLQIGESGKVLYVFKVILTDFISDDKPLRTRFMVTVIIVAQILNPRWL